MSIIGAERCGGASRRPQHASVTISATIASIETLACDAGWRNYYFVKVTTNDGVTGCSDFHALLRSKWELLREVEIPQWPEMKDRLFIYRRR